MRVIEHVNVKFRIVYGILKPRLQSEVIEGGFETIYHFCNGLILLHCFELRVF